MAKHHFVPRLIIRRFADPSGKILFYSKKTNSVSKPIPHYDQLQEGNFYSKKKLSELKTTFDHITINPLFKDLEKTLEENLSIYLESPMSVVLNKFIQPLLDGKKVLLSRDESNFIKNYIEIQHVRTTQFKAVGRKAHKRLLKLPPNIREQIMSQENKREPDIKKIIKEMNPELNHRARRKLEIQWKKKLKLNPKLLEEIRGSEEINNFLEEEINKMESKLESISNHPDKHSSEIIDLSLTNRFLKSRGLYKNNLRFVINNTKIPFVLTDTGIIIMCWDYGEKKELRVYLPIHPKLLIELSQDKEIFIVDEAYVKEFNNISRDEALLNVYSSSEKALKQLINN